MSLAVATVLAVVGLVAGSVALRALGRRRVEAARAAEGDRPGRLGALGFPVDVGDVVSVRGEEAWVESAWVMTEAGAAVAAIAFCSDLTLVALPAPRRAVHAVAEVDLALAAEPSPTVVVGRTTFERVRRLPVAIEPIGDAPTPPWVEGLLAEYRAADGTVLWAIRGSASSRAWCGRRVLDGDFESWGRVQRGSGPA